MQNFSVQHTPFPLKTNLEACSFFFTCLFLMYMFSLRRKADSIFFFHFDLCLYQLNLQIPRISITCAAHCYRKVKSLQESQLILLKLQLPLFLVISLNRMSSFHIQFPSRAGLGSMAYKKGNGLSHVENDLLCQLRQIARSETLEESKKDIAAVKDSEIWKTNTKFSIYFSKYWLTVKEVGCLFFIHENSLKI